MSYGEIAKVMNMTKGQIGGILERAGLTDPANGLFKTKGARVERLPPAVGAIAAAGPQIGMPGVQQAKRLCHWPQVNAAVDEPQCNEPAMRREDGRWYPYCAWHCRRAYHSPSR